MSRRAEDETKAAGPARRLFVFNSGFFTLPRLRRILTLAGYAPHLGRPGPQDCVGVWGAAPSAARGAKVAAGRGLPLVRIEDAFLRSVHPGRARRTGPLGLLIDPEGVHFDPSRPSRLERILASHPLDETSLLQSSKDGITRLRQFQLSKYNNFDLDLPPPDPGYVLVIDQTRGDASVAASGATEATFREMLAVAQIEHPGARILIRSHPETRAGLRPGYYDETSETSRIHLIQKDISPWALLEGAIAVYTVSSQMGFEAILAGHRPRVFGQPFYAGWGLTQDENPPPRRTRRLTRAQLFAGAMILAPVWYDPCRDQLCSFEETLDQLEAEVRAWREDRHGHVALGMRLWKRPHLQGFFGREAPLRFAATPERAAEIARRSGRRILAWGETPAPEGALRVEDGFLRSRGLGARLTPPQSLVTDPEGMHYDPARPSRLERLIAAGPPPGGAARAERLIATLTRAGLSKYNLPADALPDLPPGRRILVPGQVEDDASVRLGAGAIRDNLSLLMRVRAENPDAVILYKPHPDVAAGLRRGAIPEAEALRHADLVLPDADPAALIAVVDEVWTMTSTLGFEALLRGKAVTCLGMPFYAGWGLTRDLVAAPDRRRARPSLAALAHAVLIAYPRYRDPVSGLPCPPEVIADRLAQRATPGAPVLRLLARAQGLMATLGLRG